VSLTKRLASVPRVARLAAEHPDEPPTLAHALLDLEQLCRRMHEELLPRVFDATSGDDAVEDALADIGEALREVLYHIRDPQYYRYLPGCDQGNDD
jgi:hypothetical protein